MDPITMSLIGGGIKMIGGLFGRGRARRRERAAAKLEAERRKEMDRLKSAYSQISTVNPFLNMSNQFVDAENVFEDLTINQKQAQFESQQFAQSQANILSNMRAAAGGSGIASLAQALAQQGQLRAQQASASIGTQEATNQRLAAQEAARLQSKELAEESRLQELQRRGEIMSREQQRSQIGTMLGMAQGEVAGARAERQQYAQQADAFTSSAIGGLGDAFSTVAGMKFDLQNKTS